MILDTNALSDWAKGNASLRPVIESTTRLVLPVIVVGEYLAGAYRLPRQERLRLESWMTEVVAKVETVAVGYATARAYAAISANLERRGKPIPSNDIWIAALSVQHNLPVLSRDRHFDMVDGIQRIGW